MEPAPAEAGGRKEAMDWCEQNGVATIFGFGPNAVLAEKIFPKVDEVCVRRAIAQANKVRGFATTRYAAKSWTRTRRVIARRTQTSSSFEKTFSASTAFGPKPKM